jgi:hypothetical protein
VRPKGWGGTDIDEENIVVFVKHDVQASGRYMTDEGNEDALLLT